MKSKKILSVLIAVAMLIGLMPTFTMSLAASADDLTFELNPDGSSYYVDACVLSASGGLVIPETHNGKPVTGIGYEAFYNCRELTSVTIPDSVTNIEDYAFFGCTGLASISISDCVTVIGAYSFMGCTGLTAVTVPDSVTRIGERAFEGCENLAVINVPESDISIGKLALHNTAWFNNQPDGLVYIGKIAYTYIGAMPYGSSVALNTGTKGIADYAFYSFSTISNIIIPNTVTSIGKYALAGCSELTEVTIPDSVTSIGEYAFSSCQGLTEVIIPDSVTSIGMCAFDGCSELASITIPDTVKYIGHYAFTGTAWFNNKPDGIVYAGKIAYEYKGTMPENTSIAIADGTINITNYAFRDYSNLISVTIPDSVTNIGYGAFQNCSGLTSVTISAGVTRIGNNAFYGCSGLTSVIIPDSVKELGDDVFKYCEGLTSVTIPDSVTSIGDEAFIGCNNLTIYCNHGSFAEEYVSVWHISYGTIGNNLTFSLNDAGDSYCISACYSMAYGELVIPSTYEDKPVTSIGVSAFESCIGLTGVIIPSSVTQLGTDVFKGCTGLESLTIPNSVSSISEGAFVNCTSLTKITIPDSVTSISEGAFAGCDYLTIYCTHNSYAKDFAEESGINYVLTDGLLSDTLIVSDGVISGLKCSDSVADTLAQLNSPENIKVFDLNGNEITDTATKLGTGMVLKLYNNNGDVLDEVTVSVLGDVDGNGKTTTDDARATLRAAVGLNSFNISAQELAAEVDGEAGVTTSDARKLLRVAVGLETLSQVDSETQDFTDKLTKTWTWTQEFCGDVSSANWGQITFNPDGTYTSWDLSGNDENGGTDWTYYTFSFGATRSICNSKGSYTVTPNTDGKYTIHFYNNQSSFGDSTEYSDYSDYSLIADIYTPDQMNLSVGSVNGNTGAILPAVAGITGITLSADTTA